MDEVHCDGLMVDDWVVLRHVLHFVPVDAVAASEVPLLLGALCHEATETRAVTFGPLERCTLKRDMRLRASTLLVQQLGESAALSADEQQAGPFAGQTSIAVNGESPSRHMSWMTNMASGR